MANAEHLATLKQGIEAWNEWRLKERRGALRFTIADSGEEIPIDVETELRAGVLQAAIQHRPNLVPLLRDANLSEAALSGLDLAAGRLDYANLRAASLTRANLTGAHLADADLSGADLVGADLRDAWLIDTNFTHANLSSANLTNAVLIGCLFNDCDLGKAIGLEACRHIGASHIDHLTLLKSKYLPTEFLRGCGLPETFIEYVPSLFWEDSLQFYSCFISYSHVDKVFARRLHDALQELGVRCWLDEKQLKPGDDISDSVDRGLRASEKILLCCSKDSLASWWVDKEIVAALDRERKLHKDTGQKSYALIPLNLDGFFFSEEWTAAYATQLRQRFAADFTDPVGFDSEMEKLLGALRPDKGSEGSVTRDR